MHEQSMVDQPMVGEHMLDKPMDGFAAAVKPDDRRIEPRFIAKEEAFKARCLAFG